MAFDKAYYDRYYRDPRTAVTSRAEMAQRARMIAAAAGYVGLPVRTVLDAGCGMGYMRAPLRRALPRVEYTGLEASAYLCRRLGWEQGLLQDWRAPRRQRYDIVICYDVLQYLEREPASRAIANLGRLCRGLLYCSALTREDWEHNCDQRLTDKVPGIRPVAWYRRELRRSFIPLGCSLWVHRDAPVVTWEMDLAP